MRCVQDVQLRTFRIMAPLTIKATICTASPMDLSSVVIVVLKPISRMMIVEKELTTPLGIALVAGRVSKGFKRSLAEKLTYAAKTLINTNMVLGSKKPNLTCFISKVLFLIPVSFPATRLTATSRSRWERKRAFEGESGRNNHMMMAQRHVAPPSYLLSCQLSPTQHCLDSGGLTM